MFLDGFRKLPGKVAGLFKRGSRAEAAEAAPEASDAGEGQPEWRPADGSGFPEESAAVTEAFRETEDDSAETGATAEEEVVLDDFDKRILSMLEAEDERSKDFKDADELVFINDVSVYDPELDGAREEAGEAEPAAKPAEAEQGLPFPLLAALAGVVVVFSLAFVFVAVAFARSSTASQNQTPKEENLRWPANATNNTSFIYSGRIETLDGDEIVLSRMNFSREASVFFFEDAIDMTEYQASLSGKDGVYYPLDFTSGQGANKTLTFHPFGEDVRGFKLSISNRSGTGAAEFEFGLNAGFIQMMPAKYINASIPIVKNESRGGLFLDGASFTNTGSVLNVRLTADEYGSFFIEDEEEFLNGIFLKCGLEAIAPRRENSVLTRVGDTVMVKAEFDAIPSLYEKITVSVDAVYETVPFAMEIPAERLYDYKEQGAFKLSRDSYVTYLEGMQRQGSVVVMPLHTENEGKRVETRLAAELSFTDNFNKEHVIEGVCYSKNEGSDIVFALEENKDLFARTPAEHVSVRISGISYRSPRKNLTVDMFDSDYRRTNRAQITDGMVASLIENGLTAPQLFGVYADERGGVLYASAADSDGSFYGIRAELVNKNWRIRNIAKMEKGE